MNSPIQILLAEDDANLGPILSAYLDQRGYPTVLANTGKRAVELFKTEEIDFCILDVMIPEKDGFEVAREIRQVNKKIPILFLTAKNREEDKFEGFEAGADDYMVKPFNMEELLYRINAILRRTKEEKPEDNIFVLGRYEFDYNKQRLTLDGTKEKKLTSKEAELLRLFCININQLVDRSLALQKIWKDDSYFNARSMDVYITKLRKYIKEDPEVEIVNVHGVGFRLAVKQEEGEE